MYSRRIALILLLTGLFPLSVHAQLLTQEIKDWTYCKAGTTIKRRAEVPGSIFLDLMRNGAIPDPLKNDNASRVQWVSETGWTYESKISCTPEFLQARGHRLEFEGLDTYARVFLNDSLVLNADNMFRSWSIPVEGKLKAENILRIEFIPAEQVGAKKAAELSYTLPEGVRSFSRKAQYQYGWDWAPKLTGCGIWKPVRLVATQEFSLIDFSIRQTSFESNTAEVVVSIQYAGVPTPGLCIELVDERNNPIGRFSADTMPAEKDPDGSRRWDFNLRISNVQAWHIAGRGNQQLYTYRCRTVNEQPQVLSCTTGFRQIDLINQPDSIGAAFGFKVNGKDVFIRGANLVPPDPFPSRISDQELERLVRKARESNFNMLRVWGGGIYLPESFYNACDAYGILVWQDFMSACSMVPGDLAFQENFRQEAIEQVQRLAHHPCIALWCGNNENDEGWHNWGWQRQHGYSAADSATIWNHYLTLFHSILPEVVQTWDSRISYWPSSPSIGWGRPESMKKGDAHYWGVWWGMEPFSKYKEKTGRFMSEYGFQSVPEKSSWKGAVDTLSMKSIGFRAHQKHPKGFETIDAYLKQHFGTPRNFSDYPMLSQLQQAYGLDIAFSAHRSAFPSCRGTLFWQWNDCWPAVSWSAMDYLERPKLLAYAAKAAFDTLFIGIVERNGKLETPLHFDGKTELSVNVRLMFLNIADSNAFPVILDERRIRISPDTAISSVISFPLAQLRNLKAAETAYYVEVEDNYTFRIFYRRFYFPVVPKDLKLLNPEIALHVYDQQTLVMYSEKFAYGVYLYEDTGKAVFSENGFCILPDELKRISVQGVDPATVKWKSYNTIQKQ